MRLRTTRQQRGFSLVELMVAMGLSLVLLAGALSILYSSKVTHAENDRIARLQEAGRTVVELILRDARASGFQGCARPMNPAFIGSVIDATSAADVRWNMLQPVFGYDTVGGGSTWSPALDAAVTPNATPGSDIIVLRTTREGMPVFRLTNSVVNLGANLQVTGPAGATLAVPSTAMISDCQFATFFVVTGFAAGGAGSAVIAHGTGGVPANETTSVDRPFMVNARITPVDSVAYYVAPDANGRSFLFRRIGGEDPQPIVEGVENLQAQYGVDTNGDLLADEYDTAQQVAAAGRWNDVISVTLSVLIRSEDETNLERDERTYTLLTESFGPFRDRRQRSVFTTTVMLRNRTT